MRVPLLLFPAACLCFAIWLGLPGALYAPDSAQYRMLALGERAAVPSPFSNRILAPALAGWLGRSTGLGVDDGFLILGIICLAAFVALLTAYLWSWKAPPAIFAAIFLMPFWVSLFHSYYLPDLLHGALLAGLLGCLFSGYIGWGLLLLFPAFLARESTMLVALCLVVAGWRRIPLRSAVAGALALAGAHFVAARYSLGAQASVHGLSGGAYIAGKFLWSLCKNVLGLPLWTNTLPECNPVWTSSLPAGLHVGAIRAIGLCQPSLWGPGRLVLAWFGVFGVAPACAIALWRNTLAFTRVGSLPRADGQQRSGYPAPLSPGAIVALRFCLIYGLLSVLLTPLLGASADRLVGYGWPFYFVVVPWVLHQSSSLPARRVAGLVCLHLITGWLAWYAFQQETRAYVAAAATVVACNGLAWWLLRGYVLGTKVLDPQQA